METDTKRIKEVDGFKLSEFKRTQDVIKGLLLEGKNVSDQENYLRQLLEMSGTEKLIAQTAIVFSDNRNVLAGWTEQLNGTVIEAGQAFSLLDALNSKKTALNNSAALGVLATGIYMTVLQSNFEVLERSISRELPGYAKLGYEAKAVAGEADLLIANPNDSAYQLYLEFYDGVLYVYLTGKPLKDSYRITLEDDHKIEPRMVQQAGTAGESGESGGKQGEYAAIYRETVDKQNHMVKKEWISDDYYAPVDWIGQARQPAEPSGGEPSETAE